MTDREQEIVDAFLKTGSKRGAAEQLGCSRSTVRGAIKRIEARGEAPWLAQGVPIPEHLKMTNTTIHVKDGKVFQEWRRESVVAELAEEFVEELCESVKGKAKVKKRGPRKTDNEDILSEIDIFDLQLGAYASKDETNAENYNCDIARDNILNIADGLLGRFNKPKKIVVAFGGDQMHADGRIPVSERSGNIMDIDTRFSRVVDYMSTTSYDLVQMAAQAAEIVDVVVVRGNHDPNSSEWLAQVLRAFYHNCTNVNVIMQKSDRKHMVWGSNLLVWAHGDGIPLNRWGTIIPNEFRELWGSTKHCHVKTGHIHHRRGKKSSAETKTQDGWVEEAGVLAESLPASCFRDSYHASKGFFGQMIGCAGFEYHKKHGIWSRFYQPYEA